MPPSLSAFGRPFRLAGRTIRKGTPVSQQPGSDAQSTSAREPSRTRNIKDTAINGLLLALRLIKEGSPSCAPLQGAAAALLVILETYQQFSSTVENIKTLEERINELLTIFKDSLPADYASCPPALKKRLDEFERKVQSISADAKKLQSQGQIARFLNASESAKRIEALVKTLSEHIQVFIAQGTVAIEIAVDEVAADVRQGLETVSKDIKGLNERLAIERASAELDLLAIRNVLRPPLRHGSTTAIVRTYDDPRLASLPDPAIPALSDRAILWLYALAGAGKSTLALTVAEWWDEDDVLGATFFCARDSDRSDIRGIFRTIAYQLACRFPEFREALSKVLKGDPDLHSSVPSRQLQKLIAEPLEVANSSGRLPSRIAIVIDALDECTDNEAVSTVIKSLALYVPSKLVPLRIFITSRPAEPITRGFLQKAILENTQHLPLAQVPEHLTRRDISTFFQSRFAEMRDCYFGIPSDWPPQQQFDNLLDLAELLFIFAATAALFIGNAKIRDPEAQLTRLLESGNAAATSGGGSMSTSAFPRLDALYEQVLVDAVEKAPWGILKQILGMLALAEERLTPTALESLLKLSPGVVRRVLPALSAVVVIPALDDETTPIRLIHLSFANFIVDPARCTDERFFVQPSAEHAAIAMRCFEMMRSLKVNICDIDVKEQHLLNSEIPDLPRKVAEHVPAALVYACKYWSLHLSHAHVDADGKVIQLLEEFCMRHLLHWLEVLSLVRCVHIAIEALQAAYALLKPLRLQSKVYAALIIECERAVRAFYPALSASFMQVYHTVLPFSPLVSLLRKHYAEASPATVTVHTGVEPVWSTTLVSVTIVNSYPIRALDFSPDGSRIACGSILGYIRILDVHTGTELQVLKHPKHPGHWISSLRFSPTGKQILSGEDCGREVKLWDVATGACVHVWETRSISCAALAWSPDGAYAASGWEDEPITLWRLASPGKTVMIQHDDVQALLFTSDGTLVSGSSDKTCKVWNTADHLWESTTTSPTQTLEHDSEVCAVAASPDNSLLACGLKTGQIVLWRRSDGQQLHTLQGADDGEVLSVAFYSKFRLAAGFKSSVKLWDTSKAAPLQVLNIAGIDGVAFSSGGGHKMYAVSREDSGTVDIGQWSADMRRSKYVRRAIGESNVVAAIEEPQEGPAKVSVSPNGHFVAAAYKSQLRVWDTSTGQCKAIITHSPRNQSTPVIAWSPAGDAVAWTREAGIHIWDITRAVGSWCIQRGDDGPILAVSFTGVESPEIVSASHDGSFWRWGLAYGSPAKQLTIIEPWESWANEANAHAVSPDGRWVLYACSVWKEGIGRGEFIRSDYLLAKANRPVSIRRSRGWHNTLSLYDMTARNVLWVESHDIAISSVAFSEDGTRALAGNESGEIFLYDLSQLHDSVRHTGSDTSSLASSSSRVQRPAVPEYKFSSGNSNPLHHISFSSDAQAVLHGWSYSCLPHDIPDHLRKHSTPGVCPSEAPFHYFVKNQWLWRVRVELDSHPQRVCWIPPTLRPDLDETTRFTRSYDLKTCSWSAKGHVIAYISKLRRLVVLEASRYGS
ncbi:WD40 repeat-like protein [Trametes coccinea BRFM310]|uniref:WD40 repeat-like protein n=1 Tax=Trametes coccinea (strain BRFM310) TaxID=1353009 RepID=A0A1Y2IM94_TRAC3|nr:WD40 repeat-like protein [Trametes coccinea BRFM310]